jgi:hypothetical protein
MYLKISVNYQELYNRLTTLCFIECYFSNTNTIKEILEFATEVAHLTSITSQNDIVDLQQLIVTL